MNEQNMNINDINVLAHSQVDGHRLTGSTGAPGPGQHPEQQHKRHREHYDGYPYQHTNYH